MIFLHRHGVRLAAAQHALERGAQMGGAGRGGVAGIAWKHLENAAADDPVALRPQGLQVGVADRDDGESRVEH
jgi:hypothetical protein